MKYFATSLLAAYAFAQEDTEFWNTGVSRWNAVDGAVIDDVVGLEGGKDTGMKLSFNYYVGAKESPEELHGDFKLYFNGYEMYPNVEFGFCFQVVLEGGATEKYDCMRVRTNIDVEALATEVDDLSYNTVQQFDIVDMYTSAGTVPAANGHLVYTVPGFIVNDDDSEETEAQEKNWRLSASKSFKMGCKNGEQPGKVTCDWINAHWFRNFATTQPDQDTQLAGRPEDTEYTAYGWIASYPNQFEDYDPKYLEVGTPEGKGYIIQPNLTQAKRNALTDEEKQAIQDWEATLNSRTGEPNPVPEPESEDEEEKTDEEGTDETGTDENGTEENGTDETVEDSDADAEDSDADAEDSDGEDGEGGDVTDGEGEEGNDGAAELVTYTAAIVTAFGALLI